MASSSSSRPDDARFAGPRAALAGALALLIVAAGGPLLAEDPGWPDRAALLAMPTGPALGGTGSRPIATDRAFTFPMTTLDRAQVRAFFVGNRVFNTNWVIAPASVEAFDGLGPIFNRVSCSGCHLRDGRGHPPATPGGPMDSMLVRIGMPGTDAQGGPLPHPGYGDQIGDRAVPGVTPEARVVVTWREEPGRYGDGTPFSLRVPTYEIRDAAYGPIAPDALLSPRVAPAMIGLGLLEAVPEPLILGLADPDDADGDGISGRANRVWDPAAGAPALGRFGWKANQPGLRAQNAAAALGDIGLTSSLHPAAACEPAQTDCAAAGLLHEGPELSDLLLDRLTLYTRVLAVPMQRDPDDPAVLRGGDLFREAGCAACHMPTLVTGDHPVADLSRQTIHPFTDLLLHDMGDGLADGRPDFLAGGREWRTPPLWGLGLYPTTNGHHDLLHDGRARGPAEAILWHGGEAEAAREAFRTMPAADRAALLRFLDSL